MRTLLQCGRRDRRGVAAVEFALTFLPVLYLFAGVTDLGIVYYRETALASAVSAAAEYAEVQDQSSIGSVTAANVQTVMTKAAAQSMPGATVSPSATCYLVTGDATTAWNTNSSTSCSGTCASCSLTTMRYMEIVLTHTYSPLLPSLISPWSSSPTLTKTTWIPLP